MDLIVKYCVGNSKRVLLALFVGALMLGVGQHTALASSSYQLELLNSAGDYGADYTPYSASGANFRFSYTCKGVYPDLSNCPTIGSGSMTYEIRYDFATSSIATTTPGDYFFLQRETNGNQNDYYMPFYWNGSNISLLPSNPLALKTRLLNATASGNASTTNFKVDYFLQTTEFNSSNRPDTLALTITNVNSTQIAEKKKIILPLEQGTASTTIIITPSSYLNSSSTQLADGEYTAWFKFWNFSAGNFVFPTSITLNFVISAGAISSQEIVEQTDGLLPESTYTLQPCSLVDIGGCISNAFAFAFYPSEESITYFSDLYLTLANKFPFAYMIDFKDSITQVFQGETTHSMTITVPFGTFGDLTLISQELIEAVPFASTIRSLLGALMWLMLAMQIWRRGQTIFNKKSA